MSALSLWHFCMDRQPTLYADKGLLQLQRVYVVQKNEGCRIWGKIEVAKVAGRVQVIPGAPSDPTRCTTLCI